MEINKKPRSLLSVCGYKNRIDTNPDFQRPAVWSLGQKQLLIDTILRGYDIPKLYWRKLVKTPEQYEVVDGQQRLRAIFEFHGGEFSLAKDADDIDGIVVAKMHYEDLSEELRHRFDNYDLDVIVLTDTSEDEVREMFLRLQNGTSLKAQEKRNAMPGKMRTFIKDLAQHPFFSRCNFANTRFTHDLVAAQMTAIELNGGPCHVRNSNLNAMYEAQLDFDAATVPRRARFAVCWNFWRRRSPRRRRNWSVTACCRSTPSSPIASKNTPCKAGRTRCAHGSSSLKPLARLKRDCPLTSATRNCSLTRSARATALTPKTPSNGATISCSASSSKPCLTSSRRTTSACSRTNNASLFSDATNVSANSASNAKALNANGMLGKLTISFHGQKAEKQQ